MPEVQARILAARAIKRAFASQHVSRMGMPPSDVSGMPEKEWRPSTVGEFTDWLTNCLGILRQLVGDNDEEVREAAVATLADITNDVFRTYTRVFEAWTAFVAELSDQSYDVRGPVLRAIDDGIERWARWLKTRGKEFDGKEAEEAEIAAVQRRLTTFANLRDQLRGSDFSSRLRWALSRAGRTFDPSPEVRQANEQTLSDELMELAREATRTPTLLENEWSWLASQNTWMRVEQFVDALGAVNANVGSQLEALAARNEKTRSWVSIFYISLSRASGESDLVDQFAAKSISAGHFEQAFDILARAGYTAPRLQILVKMFGAGSLSAEFLPMLSYTAWAHSLNPTEIELLINAVRRDGRYPAAVASFLDSLVHIRPDIESAIAGTAVAILVDTIPSKSRPHSPFDWADLAARFVELDPIAVAGAALEAIAISQTAHDSELNAIVQHAWRTGDKGALFEKVISPYLDEPGLESWWVRAALENFPVADLGLDYLLEWVAASPKVRAPTLARLLGPPIGAFTDLHATLLERFDKFGVGSAFTARFNSGSWTGNWSDWIKFKIQQAEIWTRDSRPVVREWALQLTKWLRADLTDAENREAEERLE
jgi:hypothetical protein